VWLASEDCGVILFRGGRFEPFDLASGLPSSWIVDVAAADGGGVWAATLRNGAVRLDANGAVRERTADAWGLRLYDDRGTMLFGTQQGLARSTPYATPADGRITYTVPDLDGLLDRRVHALLRTARGLWVGTEGGLALVTIPQ
jgi:ligand-binding sensor domain-containing protein